MAYTGTYFQTFASGGRTGGGLGSNFPTYREQMLDQIAYVRNVETPVLNVLTPVPIWNTRYSFVMGDINFNRAAIPADVEGKLHTNVGNQSTNFRVRAWNGVHIHSKDVAVSTVQRRMRELGVTDEYSHRVWEETLALAVEFENILIWSTYVAGTEGTYGAPGTAPQTHGLFAWGFTTGRTVGTVTIAGQQIPEVYSSTYYNGGGIDISRDNFNQLIMQAAWEKGMEIDQALWFVGTRVKNVISKFAMIYSGTGATLTAAPLNHRHIPAAAYLLVDKLDIYEGDWGRVFVIKNRNMSGTHSFANYDGSGIAVTPSTSILGFEPRYAALGVFQGFEHFPLAKMGSTSNGYVEAILGTACRNPRAFAVAHGVAA